MSKKKEKQEYNFSFNGTEYTIGLGGLHSIDIPRRIIPTKDEILIDADISGNYPWNIIKRSLYPTHLGKEWLIGYKDVYEKRIQAKKEGKKSITEAYKLLGNGSYGKMGEKFSWQYSPESLYKCTIGNQIELLMLVERLETNNIHVISANTDGILCLFNKKLLNKYYKLCKQWEEQVGNLLGGNLEFTEYKYIVQTSVNDYLAVKENNTLKKRGDFTTDFELHKNKSARVIPLVLTEYYTKGTLPEDYLKTNLNIFDYCLCVKAKGKNKILLLDKKTGIETELQKVNRYYVSLEGKNLIKRLPALDYKPGTGQIDIFGNIDIGIRYSEIEAGWLSTIFNKIELKEFKDYGINLQFYLDKIYRIINLIK